MNSCIRLGKALEKYNLAWLEDMIPWYYTDLWKEIKTAVNVPLITGEDIFLKEGFEPLCREHAVDLIHPDLATSGGILETNKIGDMAERVRGGDGHALRGDADFVLCERALRGGDEELPGAGKPLGGSPVVGQHGRGMEKPIINKGFITCRRSRVWAST